MKKWLKYKWYWLMMFNKPPTIVIDGDIVGNGHTPVLTIKDGWYNLEVTGLIHRSKQEYCSLPDGAYRNPTGEIVFPKEAIVIHGNLN